MKIVILSSLDYIAHSPSEKKKISEMTSKPLEKKKV